MYPQCRRLAIEPLIYSRRLIRRHVMNASPPAAAPAASFDNTACRLGWEGRQLTLDEKPVRLLSGAIHYFRTLHQDWRDRLVKLKSLGCNVVETYVPWNLHEPRKGHFRFNARRDVEGFIDLAAELGLFVILRPGPYICAEWDMGGLPWWLLERDDALVRCSDATYLSHVEAWWNELIPRVASRQSTRGGPILAVQVENEYGYFGSDPAYLNRLRELLIGHGIDVPLFTSDAPTALGQQFGGIDGCLRTGNFGDKVEERLAALATLQPDGPLTCMEFWVGWFDAWGSKAHSSRAPDHAAASFDELLSRDALVNFYVLHGGTNFGFTNGANCAERFDPHVTSYDYDALLTECGDVTPKFEQCRDVAERHGFAVGQQQFSPSKRQPSRRVALTEGCGLNDALTDEGLHDRKPLRMEKLGHGSGFVHYETTVHPVLSDTRINLREMRDFATILLDGKVLGTQYRNELEDGSAVEVRLPTLDRPARLEILVENMGRPNFGHRITESKGIDGLRGGVFFGDQRHDERTVFGWHSRPLPLEQVAGLPFQPIIGATTGPSFYRGTFKVSESEIGDGFIAAPDSTKCVVFLNGFNLGRLWSVGPQRTLYAPSHLFRPGENEIILFESVGVSDSSNLAIEIRSEPDLG